MTIIILTIIGILLAAAAAFMVIFYGGDAFNSGSTGAAASTLQNAGTNVAAAYDLYRAENGRNPVLTGSKQENFIEFVAMSGVGGSYLKEAPSLPNGYVSLLGDSIYSVRGVSRDICIRINMNLKIDPTPSDILSVGRMGCALPESGPGIFVTRL